MLNLTQHLATEEQLRDGVIEPAPEVKAQIKSLLTFDASVMTEAGQIDERAKALVALLLKVEPKSTAAMVGGALYLMPALVRELKAAGIQPYFSYTDRVSTDVHNPDGSVTKTLVFKHLGWVAA